MRCTRLSCLAAVIGGLSACSAPPENATRPTAAMPTFVGKVDARAVAQAIVLCTTTGDELRQRLGEPTRDGRFHRSRILSWSTSSDSPSRYLAVQLDERGLVVDLYWDVPSDVSWVPANQCSGS